MQRGFTVNLYSIDDIVVEHDWRVLYLAIFCLGLVSFLQNVDLIISHEATVLSTTYLYLKGISLENKRATRLNRTHMIVCHIVRLKRAIETQDNMRYSYRYIEHRY